MTHGKLKNSSNGYEIPAELSSDGSDYIYVIFDGDGDRERLFRKDRWTFEPELTWLPGDAICIPGVDGVVYVRTDAPDKWRYYDTRPNMLNKSGIAAFNDKHATERDHAIIYKQEA